MGFVRLSMTCRGHGQLNSEAFRPAACSRAAASWTFSAQKLLGIYCGPQQPSIVKQSTSWLHAALKAACF